jgi:uncharacterized OB-fold protein
MTSELIDQKLLKREGSALFLLASRCESCHYLNFPQTLSCPQCDGIAEVLPLSQTGTLWSWTSQAYLPKTPPFADSEQIDNFNGFLIGYVELKEGIRIISRLINVTQDQLIIGMEMQITPLVIQHAQSGQPLMAYAFEPCVADNQ